MLTQDCVAKGESSIMKVKCENNVADRLTKRMMRHKMDVHAKFCGAVRKGGHELCPYLGD